MKILEIEVPEGYQVNKVNSTFERIVFKEVPEVPEVVKVGDRIKDYYLDDSIVARTDTNKVCLISLENGDRFCTPIEIKDSCNLTKQDLISIGAKFPIQKVV